MDLGYTAEEESFRAEVRSFVQRTLPHEIRQKLDDGISLKKHEIVGWHRCLNARGWAIAHWPLAWGGAGWTAIQNYIFREELELAPAPLPLSTNTTMVGPVIAEFGTEAQKSRFLGRIANLDDWWCQGFSEPDSGSDLASLRTSARLQGDHYVLIGQKTWTTFAQHADWMFCLVRTDPRAKRQEGISFLMVDMTAAGVHVRPIVTIDGAHEVNEVFFDEVKVPIEYRIGEENRGWDYAKFLLNWERTGGARVGASRQRIRRLKELLIANGGNTADLGLASRIAAVEVKLKAHEITTLRILAGQKSQRGAPDAMSSLLKIRGSEIQQEISELYLELGGMETLRQGGSEAVSWARGIAPTYFNWRKLSIYSGTNEIQRNILAKAVLGL